MTERRNDLAAGHGQAIVDEAHIADMSALLYGDTGPDFDPMSDHNGFFHAGAVADGAVDAQPRPKAKVASLADVGMVADGDLLVQDRMITDGDGADREVALVDAHLIGAEQEAIAEINALAQIEQGQIAQPDIGINGKIHRAAVAEGSEKQGLEIGIRKNNL